MTTGKGKSELIDVKELLGRDPDFVRAALEALLQAALGETDNAVPHRNRGSPTGPTGTPAPSLTAQWRRSLPARVPPMDSVDDPLRRCRWRCSSNRLSQEVSNR